MRIKHNDKYYHIFILSIKDDDYDDESFLFHIQVILNNQSTIVYLSFGELLAEVELPVFFKLLEKYMNNIANYPTVSESMTAVKECQIDRIEAAYKLAMSGAVPKCERSHDLFVLR